MYLYFILRLVTNNIRSKTHSLPFYSYIHLINDNKCIVVIFQCILGLILSEDITLLYLSFHSLLFYRINTKNYNKIINFIRL